MGGDRDGIKRGEKTSYVKKIAAGNVVRYVLQKERSKKLERETRGGFAKSVNQDAQCHSGGKESTIRTQTGRNGASARKQGGHQSSAPLAVQRRNYLQTWVCPLGRYSSHALRLKTTGASIVV